MTDEQTPPPATTDDPLATLRDENERLQAQIEQMLAEQAGRAEPREQLERQQQLNEQVRRRAGQLALHLELARAAEGLGVSSRAAATLAHRFTSTLDDDGRAVITPEPAAVLAEELKTNALLQASAARQAAAVAAESTPPEDADDPAAALAALDRSPVRKARYVARHGVRALLELARRAGGRR